jgi:tol-pal system protein YbgF
MNRRASAIFGWAAAAALLGSFAVACRAETVADRHMADMREQISRIQADRDRLDQRLGAVEIALAEERSARAPGPEAPAPAGPPRVVQLGAPEERHVSDDPEDSAERPEIKVVGARTTTKASARSAAPPEESSPARSSALDPDAKKAYEAALAQVNAKQYDQALDGLAGFLVKWPDHPYAENALYWRGEVYLAQGEHLRAAEQFEAVLARFGYGRKAPDALLKLGMCHERLGSESRAREAWNRLKREFPKSEAARKIPAAGPKENR